MTQGPWFNYATGEHDWRRAPTEDADALLYLPQSPPAEGLYRVLREQGASILDAMEKVLLACLGQSGET